MPFPPPPKTKFERQSHINSLPHFSEVAKSILLQGSPKYRLVPIKVRKTICERTGFGCSNTFLLNDFLMSQK